MRAGLRIKLIWIADEVANLARVSVQFDEVGFLYFSTLDLHLVAAC